MAAAPSSPPARSPALESGMILSSDEFLRRHELRPDIRKAELVEGVVYVASPVRFEEHAEPHGLIAGWLAGYARRHPLVRSAVEATVVISAADTLQPDAILMRREGTAVKRADGYLEGAPELVVEVAASSRSSDLGSKLRAYQRAGVSEYIVWAVEDGRIVWFANRGRTFEPLPPDTEGWLASDAFPGLRMHPERVLAGEWAAALEP
ncbi:MAG: Uma2 family endonuclease [Dehalococcoidia bacterium]